MDTLGVELPFKCVELFQNFDCALKEDSEKQIALFFGMGKDQEFLDAAHCGNIAFIEKALNQKAKRSGPLASLRRGPDVNVQDSLGCSALHYASLSGHAEIVSMLLAYKASPNLADTRGSSPLHLAAWAGHTEIVKMLLIHQYKPINPNMQTIENETPLHSAAHQGHIGAISALLAHKADPNLRNNRNETPLDLAAQYGHLQAVKMLIHAHPELVLQQSYETQTLKLPKHTCLHLASRNGHKNVVDILIAAGINVNLRTPAGSALHEAALCGKESVVRTLLQAGIDLNATDLEGRTALDILKEFPPHVTKGIISVINNFSNYIDASSRNQRNNDLLLLKQKESLKNENHVAQMSTRLPNNHHYHFNSNNHLLNYAQAGLVEQCTKISNSRTRNKIRAYNCEKSFDHGNLKTDPAYELKWYNGSGNLEAPQQSQNNSNNHNALIPSTSMSSFDLTLVNPPLHSLDGGFGVAVGNNINAPTPASAPPKKPPRRNTSVSPTHNQNNQQLSLQRNHRRSSSIESYAHPKYYDCHDMDFYNENFLKNNNVHNQRYQFTDGFIELPVKTCDQLLHSSPLIATQQQTLSVKVASDLFKPVLKSYNLNRKLKRNRDSCCLSDKFCQSLSSSNSNSSETTATTQPQSPTNYMQPPTPDHPPPSVNQAEILIHERIRPLSMEYKRRQHLRQPHNNTQSDTSKALPRPVSLPNASPIDNTQYYPQNDRICLGSSGSLNAGISYSDCNVSTDYLDEYVNDIPFAELFNENNKPPCLQQDNRQEESNNDSICQKQQRTPLQAANSQVSLDQIESNEINNGSLINRTNRQERIKNYLGRRVDNVSLPEATPIHSVENSILSPFNEEEAWERISEIIEAFGSGILNDDLYIRSSDSNSLLFDFDDSEMTTERHELATRLQNYGLLQLERILFENGYDNYKFVNGVLNERDIEAMSISAADALKLLEFVKTLPTPIFQSHMVLSKNKVAEPNQSPSLDVEGVSTVSNWLNSIELSIYTDCFCIESVYGVWDVELQTVLEINKLGHRRRILQSLSYMQETQQLKSEVPNNDKHEQSHILSSCNDIEMQQKPCEERIQKNDSKNLRRKNRPAPPPPSTKNVETLEIRAPSELLLGLPSDMSTQWRHSTLELVNEQLKYDVYYLGSTIVKDLCGTESARKSIQKLKRDDIPRKKTMFESTAEKMIFVNKINKLLQLQPAKSLPKLNNNNNQLTSGSILTENDQELPFMVCVAISRRGVEFIDIASKSSICEHHIQNINCACQDAIDLSYFAYITKEQDIHYCHVFHVDRMDLATEIILTLGQAFEVAYQLTLRNNIATEKPTDQMQPIIPQ